MIATNNYYFCHLSFLKSWYAFLTISNAFQTNRLNRN